MRSPYISAMTRLTLPLLLAGVLSCAPEFARTDLITGPTELSQHVLVITPQPPLPTRGVLPHLCIRTPTGYKTLLEAALGLETQPPAAIAFALLSPRGDTIQFAAAITLTTGAEIELRSSGLLGYDTCLVVEPWESWSSRRLPAPVREIRLWSNIPITVNGLYWTEGLS